MSAFVQSHDPHDRADGTAQLPIGPREPEESTIALRQYDDVLVVKPTGGLDRTGVTRLLRTVHGASGPVIVDLDECVLVDPAALVDLDVDSEHASVELCIVSQRLSCRRLLTRVGINGRFAVFQRLEDAMQARILAAAGYGRGWTVS